jgi:hypothetical protein
MCAIYMPPASSFLNMGDTSKYELEEAVLKYKECGHVMIIGDLNSRIGNCNECLEYNNEIDSPCGIHYYESLVNRYSKDQVTNYFGRKLLGLCRHNNMNILNGRVIGDLQGQYTSFQYNGSSVIDYCIVDHKLYEHILYFTVHDPSHVSDHAPISVCMNITCITSYVGNNIKYSQFPSSFNWCVESYTEALKLNKFREKVHTISNDNYETTAGGVDKLCSDLSTVLIDIAKCSLKKRRCDNNVHRAQSAKWYNKNVHVLKCDVLHTGKLLRQYPNDPYVRGKFILRKKCYKRACKSAKRNYMKLVAMELDKADVNNPKDFWRLLKKVKQTPNVDDGSELPTMENLIKTFGISDQVSDHNNSVDFACVRNYNNIKSTMSEASEKHLKGLDVLDNPISRTEVIKVIKKLQVGKAHGLDMITNEMLKTSANLIEEPLLKLFNMCLDAGVYPESWCNGHIVPVHKSGSKLDPSNYRPITISSCLGKVFSAILNSRISTFLDENKIISNVQIGFLKGHRTSDHLLVLKTLIDAYKGKRKHIYACFVDFAAAFDNVWHDGLINKLCKSGISCKIITLLQSMYSKIHSCIKRGNYVSDNFVCHKGTRQGCNLSPTLFKVYLNDLQDIFNTIDCDPVKAGQHSLGCLMYADDVLILSQSARGLQRSLDKLNVYCKKWRLSVNIRKTKTIIFNSNKTCHTFKLGEQLLQNASRVCYLGFMLTPSGSFKATQTYLYDKACKALMSLRTVLSRVPDLSVNAQFKLFDTMIKPILLYGSEIWGAYMYKFANNIGSLECMLRNVNVLIEKLHSKFCKLVLHVHRTASNYGVRCDLGRYPLFISIVCRVLKYYMNVSNRKDDSLVKGILQLNMSNKESWFSFIQYIIDILGFNINSFNKCNITTGNNSVSNKLIKLSQNIYLNELKSSSKLKLLASIKNNFRKEPYLKLITDASTRKVITQIRISCHKFAIETGRHHGLKVENRICKMCKASVGTEQHVLMECFHQDCSSKRNMYLSKIFNINKNLYSLSRSSLFQYIMLFSDISIIKESAEYFKEIVQLYTSYTN